MSAQQKYIFKLKQMGKAVISDKQFFLIYLCTGDQKLKTIVIPEGLDLRTVSESPGHVVVELYSLDTDAVHCRCVLMYGARYVEHRDFFKLKPGEAELMYLLTPNEHRGKGYAKIVLAHALEAASAVRIDRLLARVWYTNASSSKAFLGTGWVEDSWHIGFKIIGLPRLKVRVTNKKIRSWFGSNLVAKS